MFITIGVNGNYVVKLPKLTKGKEVTIVDIKELGDNAGLAQISVDSEGNMFMTSVDGDHSVYTLFVSEKIEANETELDVVNIISIVSVIGVICLAYLFFS